MNPDPLETRPALRCRFVRWGIAVAGETNFFARHVEVCPECQAVVREGDALEMALRQESRRVRREPPIGLERRIMHAVAATPRAERTFRAPIFVLGAAAVAALVLAFVLRQGNRPVESARVADPEAAATLAVLRTLSGRLLDAVETPGAVAVNNPLRQEIDSVYSDARFAIGFLAMNFLPTRSEGAAGAGRSGG